MRIIMIVVTLIFLLIIILTSYNSGKDTGIEIGICQLRCKDVEIGYVYHLECIDDCLNIQTITNDNDFNEKWNLTN